MKLTDKEIQQILEGNKLIAEFQEWNKTEHVNSTLFEESIKHTQFHKSYLWLMPVVEEIEKLDLIDEFNICYDSVAKGHIVSITPAFRDTFNTIITEVYEKKIDAIYDAVIRFIEWYNQNIKLKK